MTNLLPALLSPLGHVLHDALLHHVALLAGARSNAILELGLHVHDFCGIGLKGVCPIAELDLLTTPHGNRACLLKGYVEAVYLHAIGIALARLQYLSRHRHQIARLHVYSLTIPYLRIGRTLKHRTELAVYGNGNGTMPPKQYGSASQEA